MMLSWLIAQATKNTRSLTERTAPVMNCILVRPTAAAQLPMMLKVRLSVSDIRNKNI